MDAYKKRKHDKRPSKYSKRLVELKPKRNKIYNVYCKCSTVVDD